MSVALQDVAIPAAAVLGSLTGVILELRNWHADRRHSTQLIEHLWRDIEETHRRWNAMKPSAIGPQPFEAMTQCPKCGQLDIHWMRPPKPKPMPGPVRVIEDGNYDDTLLAFMEKPRTFEVHRWDGMTGLDESMFEVMRVCRECSHEWGQL